MLNGLLLLIFVGYLVCRLYFLKRNFHYQAADNEIPLADFKVAVNDFNALNGRGLDPEKLICFGMRLFSLLTILPFIVMLFQPLPTWSRLLTVINIGFYLLNSFIEENFSAKLKEFYGRRVILVIDQLIDFTCLFSLIGHLIMTFV